MIQNRSRLESHPVKGISSKLHRKKEITRSLPGYTMRTERYSLPAGKYDCRIIAIPWKILMRRLMTLTALTP